MNWLTKSNPDTKKKTKKKKTCKCQNTLHLMARLHMYELHMLFNTKNTTFDFPLAPVHIERLQLCSRFLPLMFGVVECEQYRGNQFTRYIAIP